MHSSDFSSMSTNKASGSGITIQDIAYKITEDQFRNLDSSGGGSKEKTIFILGSKGVGKSTIVNNFLDRDEPTKPTLALEYAYGRRSGGGSGNIKQVCNVWELGSLSNSHHLMEIPMKSHGIDNLGIIMVLDLSQPERLWSDLESSLNGLKQAIAMNVSSENLIKFKERMKRIIGNDHSDLPTLDIFPVPVVIVGGNYDRFQDLDPEIKKHVCRCLRSIAHTIGAALLYYSSKTSSLTKTVRETLNHFGFGSPAHSPFRQTVTDYMAPLMIWFGQDSWKAIGVTPTNSERIGITYSAQIPQSEQTAADGSELQLSDPAKDLGFRESFIDELRAQKDEELFRLIKDTEIRAKFQTIVI